MGTRENRLAEAVLTSTHNLCFGAKIRKIGTPLHTPVLLYKSGVQGGKHYTCFHDVLLVSPLCCVICVIQCFGILNVSVLQINDIRKTSILISI